MSQLILDIPAELRADLERRAGTDTAAQTAWVAEAVRERLQALDQLDYLKMRAARGSREAFKRALAKVPDVPPVPGDEW